MSTRGDSAARWIRAHPPRTIFYAVMVRQSGLDEELSTPDKYNKETIKMLAAWWSVNKRSKYNI